MTNILAVTSQLCASVFQTIGSFIVAILVLLFMITVHEFGHYIVAKIFDFKVNEFAIGMGPALYKKTKKNGEIFSIRALPLGGFCAFEGEDDVNGDPRAFNNKKPWQRILVLVAGATMNLLTALLIFIISIGCYGQTCMQSFEVKNEGAYTLQSEDVLLTLNGKDIYLTTDLISALKGKKQNDIVDAIVLRDGKEQQIQIKLAVTPTSDSLQDIGGTLESLSIAQLTLISDTINTSPKALMKGDYLLRVSHEKPETFSAEKLETQGFTDCCIFENGELKKFAIDEQTYLATARAYTIEDFCNLARTFNEGETLYLYISRGEDRVLLEYTLDSFDDAVKASDELILQYFVIGGTQSGYRMHTQNVRFGFFKSISHGIVYGFKTAFSTLSAFGQLITGKLGMDALGGPISTITMTAEFASLGLNYLLEIAGLIGISLAVFNLLPVPALDGARAVFVGIEWVRGKPINPRIEGTIHTIGLIVLLVFAVMVDLVKCF